MTGDPIWDGEVRTFDGEASGRDEPVAISYSDATGTLYLTASAAGPSPTARTWSPSPTTP